MGIRKHVIETREPLLINERASERAIEFGQPGAIQGEAAKSTAWAPLLVGGEATGVISLQNLDREGAFTDSDLRVLTTLAASLSVSLENARLIHETRQRVTELATVNEIGQAVATQLDLDGMYDLVGDLMRDTFSADLVYVAMHDAETDRIEFAYYSEGGVRREEPGLEYGQGLTTGILRSREPLLLNRREDFEADGIHMVGTPVKSYLGVPILLGDRAIGVISVQSMEEQGRFGPADARLLQTIAATVGIAIQNAQLFRDAGRRFDEMAALVDVAREISATLEPRVGAGADGRAGTDVARGRHQRGLPRERGRPVVPGHRGAWRGGGRDPRRHDPDGRGDHRRRGRTAPGRGRERRRWPIRVPRSSPGRRGMSKSV